MSKEFETECVFIDPDNPDFYEWGRNCKKLKFSEEKCVYLLESQWNIDCSKDERMDDFWEGFQSDLSIILPKVGDKVKGYDVTKVEKRTTCLYDIYGYPRDLLGARTENNLVKIGTFSRSVGW